MGVPPGGAGRILYAGPQSPETGGPHPPLRSGEEGCNPVPMLSQSGPRGRSERGRSAALCVNVPCT